MLGFPPSAAVTHAAKRLQLEQETKEKKETARHARAAQEARRHPLAAARAVGFSISDVRRLIFFEHGLLLALGVATGGLAAGVAIAPAITQEHGLPLSPILTFIGLIVVSGLFWVWLASTLATRGKLLEGLQGD